MYVSPRHRSNLKNHMASVHKETAEASLGCPFCNRKFAFEYTLRSDISSFLIYVQYRIILGALKLMRYIAVFRIRDPLPFWPRDPDPGWTTRIIFLRPYKPFFGFKYLNSLMQIRDPGWKKFVSGIQDGKNSYSGSGMEKNQIQDLG